jgi:hypothetical protein
MVAAGFVSLTYCPEAEVPALSLHLVLIFADGCMAFRGFTKPMHRHVAENHWLLNMPGVYELDGPRPLPDVVSTWLHGFTIPDFLFCHFSMGMSILRLASFCATVHRRLRHGHHMYVKSPLPACSRHAYDLIRRWLFPTVFLAYSSDEDD